MAFYTLRDYSVPNGYSLDGQGRLVPIHVIWSITNLLMLGPDNYQLVKFLNHSFYFQILGNERICYAKEHSTVDPTNRNMTLFTQNVSLVSVLKLFFNQ